MNLIPTTASGLRAPRRVQTLPQVILAGREVTLDTIGQLCREHNCGQGAPLDEAIGEVCILVEAKHVQAEFGLTEDEAALLAEEA